VILEAGSDCVRFETRVDWHERLKMLARSFFPADYGDRRCLKSSSRDEARDDGADLLERAQFEVCGISGRAYTRTAGDLRCSTMENTATARKRAHHLNSCARRVSGQDRGPRAHCFTYAFCPLGADNARAWRKGIA
jgi:alpha-mannosidase